MRGFEAGLAPSTVLALLALCVLQASAGTMVDLAETRVPTVVGESPGDRLGSGLGAGDLDGDGTIEIAASAPGHDPDGNGNASGAVYILHAERVVTSDHVSKPDSMSSLTILGSHPRERFGETVLVTDLNGDGIDDLVVGAPEWGPGENMYAGRVYVFVGPMAESGYVRCEESADAVIRGERPGDRLGSSIEAADLDGDGIDELLISAFRASDERGVRAGSVYVLRSTSLFGERRDRTVKEVALTEIRGEKEGDALRGIAVRSGRSEPTAMLALGAYHADGPGVSRVDAGKIYLMRGDEIASMPPHSTVEIDAPFILGPHPRALLGRSLAAGDIDGDGADDLAVSAYASRGRSRKADASGEVFVLFGSDDGAPDTLDLREAKVPRFRSASRWDLFGLPIMLCDLNGDGSADLVVSAQFADADDGARQRCGGVYVFRGGLRSVMEAKSGEAKLADVIILGGREFDALGGALAAAPVSGDRPDLIVGAPEARDQEGGEAAGKLHVIPAHLLAAR